jgi:uncharacterized protein (TIGR00255 family)
MTGFGRGQTAWDGISIAVELSSVNRKQGDVSITLPRGLAELEPRIRERILKQVSRGRLTVIVTCHANSGEAAKLGIDTGLARAYQTAMIRLKEDLKLSGEVTLDTVLRAPGVLRLPEEQIDAVAAKPRLDAALDVALADLVSMRQKEGRHLAQDLLKRTAAIRRAVKRITKIYPRVVKKQREQLARRIEESGLAARADDDRLMRELVVFADRADVAEELTRLESHLDQFDAHLQKDEPVGRMLDFIAQEIGRELNTLGAKSSDAAIAQTVVACKSEMERIREQIQNVE